MTKYTTAMVGITDYVGGEALRILAARPGFNITCVTGHSSVGESMAKHMPHTPRLTNLVVEDTTPEVLNGHDVIILVLPYGASGKPASQFSPSAVVVDLDADHHLEEQAARNEFYGGDFHGHQTCGTPEPTTGKTVDSSYTRQRAALPGTRRIAGSSCNAIVTTPALQFGIVGGLVESQDIVVDLIAGYSGIGKDLKRANLLVIEALQSALPHSVGDKHRHIPEVLQSFAHAADKNAAEASESTSGFTPTLAPMSRGILATVSTRVTDKIKILSDEEICAVWFKVCEDQDFMALPPEGVPPTAGSIVGSDAAHLQVVADRKTGHICALAAIDNLNRDTAGQAVQSLNIALDPSGDAGLIKIGVAP